MAGFFQERKVAGLQRRVGARVLQFAAEEFLLQNLGFDGGQPALDGGIVHEPGAPGLGGDQAGIDHVADDQIKQGLDGIVLRLGRQLAAHVLHGADHRDHRAQSIDIDLLHGSLPPQRSTSERGRSPRLRSP